MNIVFLGNAFFMAAGLFGAAFLSGPSSPSKKSDDLSALIADWVALWNSFDLSKVADFFTPEVTYFSSEKEGLIRGLDAVLEHHKGFGFVPGGKKSHNKLWVKNIQTTFLGEGTAVFAGDWHFERAIDPSKNQRGPFTIVVRKTEAGWRMSHLHFSNYK